MYILHILYLRVKLFYNIRIRGGRSFEGRDVTVLYLVTVVSSTFISDETETSISEDKKWETHT